MTRAESFPLPYADSPPESNPAFLYFDERLLQSREDLEKSYRLRYEVYCREMAFLPIADYPDGLKIDRYDECSLNFGSFDKKGEMVGTVRLVQGSGLTELPMDGHCELFQEARERLKSCEGLVEISRLAVNRNYRRRATDGLYGLTETPNSSDAALSERRRLAFPTVLRLYRAMYHAIKERDIKHLVASMEVSLYRILRVLRFPFREIGPEADYYGPVRPFYLNFRELEEQLARTRPDLLHYFNCGLDPKLRCQILPMPAAISPETLTASK